MDKTQLSLLKPQIRPRAQVIQDYCYTFQTFGKLFPPPKFLEYYFTPGKRTPHGYPALIMTGP